MRKNLFWIVVGGLSFWLPFFVYTAVLHDKADMLVSNAIALAGVILLIVTMWIVARRFPKWLWILAGIYILGPVSMGAAYGLYIPDMASASTVLFVYALCLFPPTTLWFATLNGMIYSVLIVTVLLPLFAVSAPDDSGRSGAKQTV